MLAPYLAIDDKGLGLAMLLNLKLAIFAKSLMVSVRSSQCTARALTHLTRPCMPHTQQIPEARARTRVTQHCTGQGVQVHELGLRWQVAAASAAPGLNRHCLEDLTWHHMLRKPNCTSQQPC